MSAPSAYAKLSQSIQSHPLLWAIVAVVLVFGIALVSAFAVRSSSSSGEEVGYANAKAFALEWLQKMSEDQGIEILPDATIKRVPLKEMVQEGKRGDKWARLTQHKLAPLFDAWDGRGEIWTVNGYARSEKRGWVYHFELFVRRIRREKGQSEDWEVLRFNPGGETGERPAFKPDHPISPKQDPS